MLGQIYYKYTYRWQNAMLCVPTFLNYVAISLRKFSDIQKNPWFSSPETYNFELFMACEPINRYYAVCIRTGKKPTSNLPTLKFSDENWGAECSQSQDRRFWVSSEAFCWFLPELDGFHRQDANQVRPELFGAIREFPPVPAQYPHGAFHRPEEKWFYFIILKWANCK